MKSTQGSSIRIKERQNGVRLEAAGFESGIGTKHRRAIAPDWRIPQHDEGGIWEWKLHDAQRHARLRVHVEASLIRERLVITPCKWMPPKSRFRFLAKRSSTIPLGQWAESVELFYKTG